MLGEQYMTAKSRCAILTLCSLLMSSTMLGKNNPTVRWGHQLVTPTKDSIFGSMVTDSNDGIYMAVSRESKDASGSTSIEKYLIKFNQAGDQVWSKSLGVNREGIPLYLAVDDLAADDFGNVYIFGYTESTLSRENKGKYDAFFAK